MIITALLALTATQAFATSDIHGWTVSASEDGQGCFVSRTFDRPGGTTLLLGLDTDGANHLSVLNANWSIKPKERLKLDFRLSNGGYMKHFAVGMASEGKQGFVTTFDAKFPAYFASSRALHIARGDVPVERLTLDGSGAAIAELRKCVAAQHGRPKPATHDGGDTAGIPRDPFSSKATAKPKR